MKRYEATLADGRIVEAKVETLEWAPKIGEKPRPRECFLWIDGEKMRAVYDERDGEADARMLVRKRCGPIKSWRVVG